MKQGRRLPCHQHRAGPLGSQTEPVPQKCAPSSPATSSRQGAAPILTCRNRYPCRFQRTPRLNRRVRDRIRTATRCLFMGAAPIENP